MWKTPHGMGNLDDSGKIGGSGGGEFAKDVAQWQSPQSRDWKSGEILPETADKHLGSRPLNEQVRAFQSSYLDRGWGQLALSMTFETFTDEALVALGNAIKPNSETQSDGPTCWCETPGCAQQSHKRKLNPLFVTVLMGWRVSWLASEPLPYGHAETELFHFKLRSRLRSLLEGSD